MFGYVEENTTIMECSYCDGHTNFPDNLEGLTELSYHIIVHHAMEIKAHDPVEQANEYTGELLL